MYLEVMQWENIVCSVLLKKDSDFFKNKTLAAFYSKESGSSVSTETT